MSAPGRQKKWFSVQMRRKREVWSVNSGAAETELGWKTRSARSWGVGTDFVGAPRPPW